MRYPLRPFTATLTKTDRSIRADLRDHTGKLWTFEHGWTYGEVAPMIENAAFVFGGQIVAWRYATEE